MSAFTVDCASFSFPSAAATAAFSRGTPACASASSGAAVSFFSAAARANLAACRSRPAAASATRPRSVFPLAMLAGVESMPRTRAASLPPGSTCRAANSVAINCWDPSPGSSTATRKALKGKPAWVTCRAGPGLATNRSNGFCRGYRVSCWVSPSASYRQSSDSTPATTSLALMVSGFPTTGY